MSRSLVFLVSVCLCSFLCASRAQPVKAGCQFDLAFLLDRSESVTVSNFSLLKAWVKRVVGEVLTEFRSFVGADGMQFALVPFNTYANVHLYLNQTSSVADLFAAVDSLHYIPGLTNPYDAMDKAVNDVFTVAKGDRPNETNVIIYVSDGVRTNGAPDPAPLAEKFRGSQNGQVISVGVEGINGDSVGVFYQQLLSMAGTPANVFNVTSYDGLVDILKGVTQQLNCNSP